LGGFSFCLPGQDDQETETRVPLAGESALGESGAAGAAEPSGWSPEHDSCARAQSSARSGRRLRTRAIPDVPFRARGWAGPPASSDPLDQIRASAHGSGGAWARPLDSL